MTRSATGSPIAPLRTGATPRSLALGERYRVKKVLGEGGNGVVGVAETTNPAGETELVAVKQTIVSASKHAPCPRARPLATAVREARMQALCHDHVNIATAFDLVQDDRSVFLVMELGADGDLFDHVVKGGCMAPEAALRMLRQLASAVAHMHARNIAHLDIKPENVLLTHNATVPMLADFGCAVEFRPGDRLRHKRVGTLRCYAPEMFVHQDESGEFTYNPMQLDVWALGVTFFFMLTTRFPFDAPTDGELKRNIATGKITALLPHNVPDSAIKLLKIMLRPNPHTRATAEQVVCVLDGLFQEPPPKLL